MNKLSKLINTFLIALSVILLNVRNVTADTISDIKVTDNNTVRYIAAAIVMVVAFSYYFYDRADKKAQKETLSRQRRYKDKRKKH